MISLFLVDASMGCAHILYKQLDLKTHLKSNLQIWQREFYRLRSINNMGMKFLIGQFSKPNNINSISKQKEQIFLKLFRSKKKRTEKKISSINKLSSGKLRMR